jgi:hypothetical protein
MDAPERSRQPADALDLAAYQWREFPVRAQLRPLVLTGVIVGLGTVATDEAAVAVHAGRLAVDASVPPAAVEAIQRAGLLREDDPDSKVRVTTALPSSMGFSTDRGGRQSPSWLLSISGVDGTTYVMGAESQALAYPFEQPVTATHRPGGYARLLGDGLSVRVDFSPPWLTKNIEPTSSAVDVLETDTAVVFAPRPDGDSDPGVGAGMAELTALTFRLGAPLGARVLCDVGGSPLIVARRKRSRGGR